MISAEDIATSLAKIVAESESAQITGAKLGSEIKSIFPQFQPFEYGCVSLRDFIRKHAPSISEIGNAGGDILYGVGEVSTVQNKASFVGRSIQDERDRMKNAAGTLGESTTGPTQPISDETAELSSARNVDEEESVRVDSNVWKTFSSPSTYFKLFANPSTNEFRVISHAERFPELPWIEIPSCTAEKHIQIAKDFVERLSDPVQKSALNYWIGNPNWWFKFFDIASKLGLSSEWSTFRGARVNSELREALRAAGLRLQSFPFSAATTVGTQQPNPSRLSNPIRSVDRTLSSAPLVDHDRIRRVAAAVVRQMSESELRNLSLPLGRVLDSLEELN